MQPFSFVARPIICSMHYHLDLIFHIPLSYHNHHYTVLQHPYRTHTAFLQCKLWPLKCRATWCVSSVGEISICCLTAALSRTITQYTTVTLHSSCPLSLITFLSPLLSSTLIFLHSSFTFLHISTSINASNFIKSFCNFVLWLMNSIIFLLPQLLVFALTYKNKPSWRLFKPRGTMRTCYTWSPHVLFCLSLFSFSIDFHP